MSCAHGQHRKRTGAGRSVFECDVDFHIPISTDYPEHPKTLRLIRLAGARADCFPMRLWAWACRYRRSGRFEDAGEIEQACRWDGEAGVLHKALVDSGFLEKDGKTIHDWKRHAGAWIQRYEEKRERDRERIALKRSRGDVAATSDEVGESRVGESSAIKDPPPSFLQGEVQGPDTPARARVGNTVPIEPDPHDSPQRRAGRELAVIWFEVNGEAADVPLEKAGQHFSSAIHKGIPFGEVEAAIRREENWKKKPWKITDALVDPPKTDPRAPVDKRIPDVKQTRAYLNAQRAVVEDEARRRASLTAEQREAEDAPLRKFAKG